MLEDIKAVATGVIVLKRGKLRVSLFLLLASALLADEPRLIIDSGGHQARINFVAFTRDGKYLVSAGDDKVIRVWDLASGKTVRTIRGQNSDGDEGKIFAAALSPDERYLAVGGWLDASPNAVIRVHDLQTGDVVALLPGHTNVVISLAFSPDGRYLASGSGDKTVRVWDITARKSVVLPGHRASVCAVAFSPDGQWLVSASFDKTLRLWEAGSGKLLKEMTGHQESVYSAAFSPDGRYIASGSVDGTVRLWNGQTGEFIKELAKQGSTVAALSFSPDGRTLLTGRGAGDNICHTFEVPSGMAIASFSEHTNIVTATAFSWDGKLAATGGGGQNEIYLWDPTNAKVVRKLVGAGQMVISVGFALDGKSVAFGNTWKIATYDNRGERNKERDHG